MNDSMMQQPGMSTSADRASRTPRRGKAVSACAGGLLAAPLLLSPVGDAAAQPAEPESPPNVLMIIADDLRPEFPAFGVERVHAPNLDRLAGQSVVFERAYCQTPVCGPSRASFLTGLRPEGDRFRTNQDRVHKQVPDAATIPGHFQDAGYTTRAFGKVFHGSRDMAEDWTHQQYFSPKTNSSWRRYQTAENIAHEQALAAGERERRGPAVEIAPNDATLRDTHIASAVIEEMRQQHEAGQPFMLAAGFFRPHLPFIAPQKDFDRYPPESIELPTSDIPKGAKPAAHNFGELRSYGDIPRRGPVSDEKAVELVRGYLASVTHVDREIGRLLDALDELGIADNTVVVVFGDHGWFLRDHGLWCKHSTFHDAIHVPLIVRAPGVKPARSDALVELVDVFPTLSELAGLPIHRQCEGNSLVPLLHDPQRPWKEAVFTRFMNQNTVVTERYLYSEFGRDGQQGRMVYDLIEDPVETVNLARDPQHRETVTELAETLDKGWRHVRPDNTPVEARVDDAAERLRVEAEPWDGRGPRSMSIRVTNDRFDAPLTIHVEAMDDRPEGWRIDLGDGTLTVEPGASATLPIRVEHDAGTVRYPLPTLRCSVELAPSGSRAEALRASSTLELPIIGSQPRLTLAPAPSAPAIDGKLRDAAWSRPAEVPLLGRMDRGQPIDPVTRAWGSYDDEAIYFAFRCHESRIDKIKATVENRDGKVFGDDSCEVMLDTDGQGSDYRHVIVNTLGTLYDAERFDKSIDLEGVRHAAHVGEDGWSLEIAIPWQSLGVDDPPRDMTLLLARTRYAGGEPTVFQFPLSPSGNHQPDHFARVQLEEVK